MSDEKRQTRLLPFRGRRAGAARAGARTGLDGAEDFSADAELNALLRAWDAPEPTAGARERLLADFRAASPRPSLWRRALSAEIRLPLPVAACAALVLLVSLAVLATRPPAAASPGVAAAAAEPAVRVVEVPVVEERVVTRTVYVEKKERGAPRGVSSRDAARETASAGRADVPRAEAAAQRAEPAAGPEARAGYFTRVDMNDYQPADEVKIRMLTRGSVDEK